MRPRPLPFLLVVATAACGNAAGRAAPPASRPATSLAGTEWRLVGVERDGTTTPVAERPYRLRFDDHGEFHAGVCNLVSGPVTHGDGWVELPDVLHTTQMRCAGEGAAVEAAFYAIAGGRVETVVDEPRLAMRGGHGVTLHYERGAAYGAG